MVVRVLLIACVCILTLAYIPTAAGAQSQESGFIVVTVTDASGGKPIDNAQVFLLGGDQPQSSLTNAKGLLIFESVQPGIYHVQVKAAGFADSDAVEADVGEGQRVNVAVALAPAMRIIASIVAHGQTSVTTEDVNANSAQRKVSQSLIDALGKLAGVDIEDDLYGSDSAFNISLRGADASQTGYSIDGVQIHGGAAQGMGGLQDLFGGASVNFAPSAMSPAGMVSFYTAQPTKMWSYHFTGVAGNYANTLGAWTVSGGAGKAAFVYEHAAGGKDFPLQGAFYADASGEAYAHQGGYSRNADLFKMSLALSHTTTLKYSLITGDMAQSYICSSATALLPCGYGPGNVMNGRNSMQNFEVSSLAGHLEYNVFVTRSNFHSTDSQPNRAVNGTVSPLYSSGSYPWLSGGAYVSASKGRHTVSAGLFTSWSSSRDASTFNAITTTSDVRDQRYGSIWVADKIKTNDKLAVNYTLSQASGTGSGTNLELYADATWQPRSADVFSAGIGLGDASPWNTGGVLGDALSAQYDCYNKSVIVEGPGNEPTRQSSLQYNAGWRHTWKGGSLTLNAYRNDFLGESLYAGVPFAAENASIFPNGPAAYLASLEGVWAEPTVCGSIPFDPSRVYVDQSISGLNQVTQGLTLSGRIALTRTLLAFPSYAVTSTAISSLDPRLAFPGSYYAPGAQLPHHPLHTAGLTLDAVMPRQRLEWLLNAQFTAANNWQNLPAYTIYNAGVVVNMNRGSLRAFESNLFGAHTGLFTTYEGVNPLPVQGGGAFAFATTPLPPRSFTVEYDVHWQQHSRAAAKPGGAGKRP